MPVEVAIVGAVSGLEVAISRRDDPAGWPFGAAAGEATVSWRGHLDEGCELPSHVEDSMRAAWDERDPGNGAKLVFRWEF